MLVWFSEWGCCTMSEISKWRDSSVFPVFPNLPIPDEVVRASGCYLETARGERLLDMTAGGSHYAIVGWDRPEVNQSISDQLSRYAHVDYKLWRDPRVEELASLLISRAPTGLDRVYFAGNSGAEACEAAMKMSYQLHCELGHESKTWFIGRDQSYHGSTSDALALGDRPNLAFFHPMLNPQRTRVPMHHYSKLAYQGESESDYAQRCADQLEAEILRIGPHRVAAFVGETMMGGLVGDVPPVGRYWSLIREVCDQYDVHLIMDEIYCGTGTSGTYFCCERDEVTPDFLLLGKTLAAGYGPIDAVITRSRFLDVISAGQGRLQHTTTFQAHSLSVVAALAVQRIVCESGFLHDVEELGQDLRAQIRARLGEQPAFKEVRGRGLRFSVEHTFKDQVDFGRELEQRMRHRHGVLVSAKWHRISITPPLVVSREESTQAVDQVCDEFVALAHGRELLDA